MTIISPAHLRLIAITERRLVSGDLVAAVAAVLQGGATAIMLREKDMTPRELLDLAFPLRRLTMQHGAALIINRSVEVALAVGADAMHLGFDALDPTTVMTIAGDRLSIGHSAHKESDVEMAGEEGLAYVSCSPVFAPNSKQATGAPLGIEGLARLCSIATMPVVALGGITPQNARACIDAGAVGVAAIGALLGASDPRGAARAFRQAIDS